MYKPFLKSIADHFYAHHRSELKLYRFYFQNRRAGLFFLHYLKENAQAAKQTIILPQVTTLVEQLRRKCHLPEADVNNQLLVIYQLYLTLRELGLKVGESTFSDFYRLGEYIINDFGDLDKHLKDPEQIYTNAADLAELSVDTDYLDEHQRDSIKRFFSHILDSQLSHEKSFYSLFKAMPSAYDLLKKRLRETNLAYDGMVMRRICEEVQNGERSLIEDGFRNVFVGLNSLSVVERKLLKHYQEDPNTRFYWDYEGVALQEGQIAGAFKLQNEKNFPSPTPPSLDYIDFEKVNTLPEIDLVSIPSKVAQAVFVGDNCINQMCEEWKDKINDLQVAVVLPNERLLMPLLSNFRADLGCEVNVTMGYPLREMPLVGMFMRLIAILKQVRLRYASKGGTYWRGVEVKEILAGSSLDPFFEDNGLRQRIVEKINKEKCFRIHTKEAMSRIWDFPDTNDDQRNFLDHLFFYPERDDGTTQGGLALLEYFIDLVERLMDEPSAPEDEQAPYTAERSVLPFLRDLLVDRRTAICDHLAENPGSEAFGATIMEDLLHSLFTYARIPYKGEPLKGLQVMGVLETRGLDFDIVLIPDATEGVLPGYSHLKSIIPHVIRLGHGLPTYEWHERTRAYNFFRLISRASQLYCTYDARRSHLSSGEPSRYFRLIEYLYDKSGTCVTHRSAGYPLRIGATPHETFRPDPEKCAAFRESVTTGSRHLSASALNEFLSCPLRFYAAKVEGIGDQDELAETMDTRVVGTVVHNTLHDLYSLFEGRAFDFGKLRSWLDAENTDIDRAILKSYEKEFGRKEMGAFDQLLASGARAMVRNVIDHDLKQQSTLTRYIGGEVRFESKVPLGEGKSVNIVGYIDRLHTDIDGALHIVDFKTGNVDPKTPLDIADDRAKNNKAGMQLLLYSLMLSDRSKYQTTFDRVQYDRIIPELYKPLAKDFTVLKVKKGTRYYEDLLDFSSIQDTVAEIIPDLLDEIVDPQQSYVATPNISACSYCPIANLCSQVVKS